MSIFKRLFKIGQAEAHSAIEKLEDPIKLSEQGIRDLKADLDKSMKALAEVKAMEIRARGEINKYNEAAKSYEQKAMLILKKAQEGKMEAGEADRLATEALKQKEQNAESATRAGKDLATYEKSTSQLDQNVKKLRSDIGRWENELKTLKARAKVSEVTKNLNKQMAQIDSSSTVSMLEKMKDKVAQEEALAESYGEMANDARSLDDELDQALEGEGSDASASLEELKRKMGMQ